MLLRWVNRYQSCQDKLCMAVKWRRTMVPEIVHTWGFISLYWVISLELIVNYCSHFDVCGNTLHVWCNYFIYTNPGKDHSDLPVHLSQRRWRERIFLHFLCVGPSCLVAVKPSGSILPNRWSLAEKNDNHLLTWFLYTHIGQQLVESAETRLWSWSWVIALFLLIPPYSYCSGQTWGNPKQPVCASASQNIYPRSCLRVDTTRYALVYQC